jgi:hypothetical protein
MSSSKKTPAADRSHGGPGSSQQDARDPVRPAEQSPHPDEPTNSERSRVSGGGGERDRHHTHDPRTKS